MKKRILALAGAVVLTLSMTMTAFATPSTEAGDVGTSDSDVIVVRGVSDEYDDAFSVFNLARLLSGTEYEDENWADEPEDFEVIEVGEGEDNFPVTVKFNKSDYAGKPLVCAYFDGAWVILTVSDGGSTWNVSVSGETALRVYDVKTGTSGEGESESETPKTGDTTSFVWFAVALAAAATAVVATKRKMA